MASLKMGKSMRAERRGRITGQDAAATFEKDSRETAIF